MAGKTPHAAVQGFIEPLQQALSCVTQAVLKPAPGAYKPGNIAHVLALGGREPARLSGVQLFLDATIYYRIIETRGERDPWKPSASAYLYTLLDHDRKQLLAWHWHPDAEHSRVGFPHLHLGAGALVDRSDLQRKHIPTGRIAIEHVIRFTIQELGAEPQQPKWEQIIAEGLRGFET